MDAVASDRAFADLGGKTVVVTGATSGIGRAAAEAFARLGGRVVLVGRSRERGEEARSRIAEATGNRMVELAVADLSSQRSTRRAAGEIVARHPEIHVLVNNAAVWLPTRGVTEDGIETTWATNVLAYHLMAKLLRPALAAAGAARIVNVASTLAGGLDLGDVEYERRPYQGREAYAQSKQADRMLTWALARRLAGTGVTANAVHPRLTRTGIFRKAGGLRGLAADSYVLLAGRPPERGADTAVWLASSEAVAETSGRFWVDRREHPCEFRDPGAEEVLWELCERMTAGPEGSR